ncbi:ABC-2 family transporter protein [Atopostipes suicloacalis DSM 15692]|uniref:ABC-2 family transporter protein n=1 Tax=Atopostipes suicloacalis DSM 15692 TaxID=1121025 RepID=A0A1M4UDU3_9LACT|nr:ABC transporter permease subunit [Atopostipes suicloacalis]SHE54798.1 ABC-2 family transporter protein [Atopostipes suicloacalis DSM 15692]
MFSKPIFKQSVQANWRLWVIITIVASTILSGFIISYDATGYASIAAAAEGTAFSNILSSMTSLLGSLENFYKLIAVILGIVYVVFTANNLVVNEVDSGSMAYTLSTPITRLSVIFTKSLYLILSVILMYILISLAGLGVSQLQYNNVTGYPITDDVKAATESLNQDERYISERLYLIQEDEDAMWEAAAARDMDTDAYAIYIQDVIDERSYEEAAEIITDEREDIYEDDDDMEDEDIEITTEELIENPEMILASNDALAAGARVHGFSVNEYLQFITDEIAALEAEEKEEAEGNHESAVIVTEDNAELLLQTVVDSSANVLNVNSDQVKDNMTLIKEPTALSASTEVTGLTEEQIIMMANHAMVSSARSVDEALDFDTEAYFWLSFGLLLLILAMSSISFFASTLFNRTGLALAIGGGLPFAFFLITMIQQLMDSTDSLEYFTITSLFDTDTILASGEFGWRLVALGGIALVLYTASNAIFIKKDLPL